MRKPTYTIHSVLTDSTFTEQPICTVPNKRDAIRTAKMLAADAGFDVAEMVVCNGDDVCVARFPLAA